MQVTLSPRRRLGGLLATLAVLITPLAAVTVTSAAPASAAGCNGLDCHGHDPNVYGCTVTSQRYAYSYSGGTLMATLANKYSQACNSNWAQATLSQTAKNDGWNFRVYIDTTDSQGHFEYMCYDGPGSLSNTGFQDEYCQNYPAYKDSWTAPTFTDMVDGTHLTSAYLVLYDRYGNQTDAIYVDQ